MNAVQFDTLMIDPTMEYKYVLVSHCSGPNTVRVVDLSSESGLNTTGFGLLFKQGWTPVREMHLGGGGESMGTSIMVLLSRIKKNGNGICQLLHG